MTTISHLSVDERDAEMSQIGPVLAEFNAMVLRYCEALKNPPYWFTERASISLLAAAAWRCHWIGIEEYSTRKVLASRSDPNQPVDRHGRCDLYLRSPEGMTFAIEAKQVVAKPFELDALTSDALRRARNDAQQLFLSEARCRVALTFVVPTLPATSDEHHAEEFDTWLARCQQLVSGPRRRNHAYVFPHIAREFLGPGRRGFWPGVIVIAQRIRRRASGLAPQDLDEQLLGV